LVWIDVGIFYSRAVIQRTIVVFRAFYEYGSAEKIAGFGIRDPGWINIRIRDPGLTSRFLDIASPNNYCPVMYHQNEFVLFLRGFWERERSGGYSLEREQKQHQQQVCFSLVIYT
jgi:hypothetical protein